MQQITHKIQRLTHSNIFRYTPVSTFKIQNKINPIVSVTIGNKKDAPMELHFRLFENVVPRTAQNFRRLLLGTASYGNRKLSLIGNNFSRQIPRAYIELGHLKEGNCSIFGEKYRDESFELLHDRPGLLSSISEANTNSSPFIITTAPCPFLDLKYVVFGEITAETFHHLRTLERLQSRITEYQILETKELPKEAPQQAHGHHH